MKKTFLSFAVIISAIGANAQAKSPSVNMDQKVRFSLGAELAAPLGNFKKTYSFGFGGSVQGDYWVDPTFAITLHAGYINFRSTGVTTSIIPVLGGVKYNFSPQFYGSAQLGIGIFTTGGYAGVSTFAYAPGIGYKFTDNFDALLKYQAYGQNGFSNNTLGLRIAYTF